MEQPPIDRGMLSTEQRLEASMNIDAMSVEQTLRLINAQDRTVADVVREAIPAIAGLTEAVVTSLQNNGRLLYVGAGTSGRLGVLDASECPPTFHSDPEQVIGLIAGGERALRQAVEGAEDDRAAGAHAVDERSVNAGDVVLGIAAGGTTPYVWGALAAAHERGAITGLLTCVPLGQLPQPVPVEHPVELPVGPEVVTGSTRLKAGTATKLALNMITTTAFVQIGKVWGNLMVDLRATNAKLRDRALRILTEQTEVDSDTAAALLDQANGRTRIALVMAKLNVDVPTAEAHLRRSGERLRPILGPPRELEAND